MADLRRRVARLVRGPAVRAAACWLLLALICAWLTPGFLDFELRGEQWHGTLLDIAHRATPTLLVALGMTLVIGTGGVDLSVGAVMAIAATTTGLAVRDHGAGPAECVLLALAVGGLAGAFNGALVAWLHLQPIVATLILFTAGRGIAQMASSGTIVTFQSNGVAALASGAWLSLPITIWISCGALALLFVVVRRSAFGLYLQALGDNPRAAAVAGLPVGALILATYALCSGLSALAGVLAAAEIRAGDPSSTGLFIELDAILAVVIGGTELRGGRTRLVGTVFGVLILQTLTTTVLMHGARLDLALIVKALAVLAVVAAQSPRLGEWSRVRREAKA